jgi:hypothetical protein
MPNILDPLQKAVAKAFKGKLLIGTLSRATATSVNEYGDPVPGIDQSFHCEGFPDNYDDAYRKAAGIPETSVKLILIAGNTTTDPRKTDKVTFRGITYEILKVKTDPALAHYECEAYRVN